jgi:geranylgeranyl diphosphate synthase, type II
LNMPERLDVYIGRRRYFIEAALEKCLPLSTQPHAQRLNEALRYAVFPGGKRWRPVLTLLGAELVGASARNAMLAACAMEFLHTSSIIFDDLPAMDDAEMRRGIPALHRVFGEGVALLAALALLNESYGLLARAAHKNGRCETSAQLIIEAAKCVGGNGMIGGQAVDLALRGAGQGTDALYSRNLKTMALMRLTLRAGALTCGATEGDATALGEFGESLGMAYQICDDIMDDLGADTELGKPAKQDARHRRLTCVTELGVEGARRLASGLIAEGTTSLREMFGAQPEVELLSEAAMMILQGALRLSVASAVEA